MFDDDMVGVVGREVVDDLGLPTAFEDVFAPAVELVVVVGVVELVGWVHVASINNGGVGVVGPIDEIGDGSDCLLAAGGVQRAIRMTEAVLHVDDDNRGRGWIVRHSDNEGSHPLNPSGGRFGVAVLGRGSSDSQGLPVVDNQVTGR